MKQTIREFDEVCKQAGVQASMHSDPAEIFKLELQPVRRLDYLVNDIATTRTALEQAEWATRTPMSAARNGIVVRFHQEEAHALPDDHLPLIDGHVLDTPLTVHYFGLDLLIEPGVYEPDPRSATFVRQALAKVAGRAHPIIVDIGTGSGSIALAIAHTRKDARVIGTDISDAAVTCASNNADRLGIENVEFGVGPLFEMVPDDVRGKVDVVVANMPWVCALEVAISRLEETHWRGPLSTVCGTDVDGLGLVRDVAREARGWLREDGVLIVMAYRWQLDILSAEISQDYDPYYVEADQLLIARFRSGAASHAP